MSQNKRKKMDLGATCSSASVNTQEMSTSVLDVGGEPHIAQSTARANYRAGCRSTNENEEKEVFGEIVSDFREAVKWSGFIDRSLLIKELLSKTYARRVIILAPKRFGKSMNVDMVKCFFEIEGGRDVTKTPEDLNELENFENFKAFTRYGIKQPCEILKELELVKKHFGRHPVVHITFKNVDVSSTQAVEDSLKQLVHRAYLAHSYLKNGEIFSDSSDNEDANKECRLWCDPEKYKNRDEAYGLQSLIKYLHAYHKRKVYLLVDESDTPAVEAKLAGKSRDEVKNISYLVVRLLGAAVKGEVADNHLLGSLITGVNYLGKFGFSDDLNNVPVYKWLLNVGGRFSAYYGLSHDEPTTDILN